MFAYDMSKAGSESLYHYLYKCIQKDILFKKIEAHSRLPSKRSLAQNLGVSVVTVENAYAQLLAEGFIYSLPKKGFYVADIQAPTDPKMKRSKAGHKAIQKQDDEPERIKSQYICDFASNAADLESFPFTTWAKITREVLCERQRELLQVSPSEGILELRKAIAHMLEEFRGIRVEASQIVIGAGTDYLYGLLLQLLGLDKCYAVEDPGYNKISKLYSKYNVDFCFIPVESEDFVSAIEKSQAQVVHLSPSHHFPTGKVMPVAERYRLLSWAAASNDRYIIEDDYDSEFRMVGRPIPSLQNIDVLEKVIYLNTFSKTMTSTIRLSYMVLPKVLAQKFHDEFSFYSCTVSNLDQYAMARFMEGGFYETHINRMRNLYRAKRDTLLIEIRKSKLSKIATVYEEDAGLHFILGVNTALSDEEFCRRAKAKGVHIRALSEYYFEAEPSAHKFIINYSSVEKSQMAQAVQALANVIR
ncbi:MAG: PLP-dependent aminotransferase family protein [Fibrobacter sp.]|nr:PLP-dependent aminotransferase family protein [Fibrobacter sp.]